MPYTVSQACKRCGRTSKFPSTDKVRACPLCVGEERQAALAGVLPEQFKRKVQR